ncbi:hypothetical protein BC830DRAFT_1115833 [Chytriomyces sp. MP71]|nr:hypothetical protein BC830DRAFT_1115833 [Chytriomyces sp. MP71]
MCREDKGPAFPTSDCETSMLCTSPPASSLVSGATPTSVPGAATTSETLVGHEPRLSVRLDALEGHDSCAAVSPVPASKRLTPAECIEALVEPSCAKTASYPLRIRSLIAASFNSNLDQNALAFATHTLTIIFEVLVRRMETQTCVPLGNARAAAEFLAWVHQHAY